MVGRTSCATKPKASRRLPRLMVSGSFHRNTCHLIPPSEIDSGLFWNVLGRYIEIRLMGPSTYPIQRAP